MLKNCLSLVDCERILSDAVEKVRLLGDIPISESDLERLGELIHETFSNGTARGARNVMRNHPSSLACFLVWAGVYGYKEGDYWSTVEERVGFNDVNWHQKWGKFFLDFLSEHQLETFDLETTHKYVTPILAHGGIPNSCLDEYFGRIVYSHVVDNLDALTEDEVFQELRLRREDEQRRKRIEASIKSLALEISRKEHEITVLRYLDENWDRIGSWFYLQQPETAKQDAPIAPPTELQNELGRIEQQKDELFRQQQTLIDQTSQYSKADQTLLDAEDEIRSFFANNKDYDDLENNIQELQSRTDGLYNQLTNSWRKISNLPLNEKIIKSIAALPLQSLRQSVEQEVAVQYQSESATRPHQEAHLIPFWPLFAILGFSSIILILLFTIPDPWKRLIVGAIIAPILTLGLNLGTLILLLTVPIVWGVMLVISMIAFTILYLIGWRKQKQEKGSDNVSTTDLPSEPKQHDLQDWSRTSLGNSLDQLPIQTIWFSSKESRLELIEHLQTLMYISQEFLLAKEQLSLLAQKQTMLRQTIQSQRQELEAKLGGMTLQCEKETTTRLSLAHQHKQTKEAAIAIQENEISPKIEELNQERTHIEAILGEIEKEDNILMIQSNATNLEITSEKLFAKYEYRYVSSSLRQIVVEFSVEKGAMRTDSPRS